MAKHLTLSNATESTKRALRTTVQVLAAVSALTLAVAIPPVADAANALLAVFGSEYEVTPALIASIGALAAAVGGLAAKVQNIIEGRDKVDTIDDAAAALKDLQARYADLSDAYVDAVTELKAAGR